MSYVVSWDGPSTEEPDRGHEIHVNTVAELDQALDRALAQATAEDLPYAVQIHRPGHHGAVMLGLGHPQRSFLDWLDRRNPTAPPAATPSNPTSNRSTNRSASTSTATGAR